MKTHLKIKIKSLIDERKHIVKEMTRWDYLKRFVTNSNEEVFTRPPMWGSLNHHELVLKSEVRACHLAYGFLRGKEYSQIENICYEAPNWAKVRANVKRFGEDQVQGNQHIDVNALNDRYNAWQHDGESRTTEAILLLRGYNRVDQRKVRKQLYMKRFVRSEPTDQAKLKAELKAKWETRHDV